MRRGLRWNALPKSGQKIDRSGRLFTMTLSSTIDIGSAFYDRAQELTLQLLRAEREAALRLRNQGRINDEVLRLMEHELDLRESQFLRTEEVS